MTKSKSSASSIIVPSFFVKYLVNDAQFLNATCVSGAAVSAILPLTKIYPSL